MRALAVAALLALGGAPASAAPSWDLEVELTGAPIARAAITWRAQGLAVERLCLDIAGAGASLRRPRLVTPDGERPLAAAADDPDCLLLEPPTGGSWHVAYEVDLAAMAAAHDPDLALRTGDSLVWSDQALFLRPDPLPEAAAIEVRFRLPPGADLAAPWRRSGDGEPRFTLDRRQCDTGAYVAVGRLRPLGELVVAGAPLRLVLLDGEVASPPERLRRWVEEAAALVAAVYQELPGEAVQVILLPISGRGGGGVFGSVLRGQRPSLVLYFGADSTGAAFDGDWVSVHELFHLGNPLLVRRLPWLTEGLATYYQDVLRARGGIHSSEHMWSDLHDGIVRFAQPRDGRSLLDESRQLRIRHAYQRLYWGAAAMFFRLDVAIRRRTGNRRSLDTLIRELRQLGLRRPLTEEQLLRHLDRASGGLASRHLRSRRRLSFADEYRFLGLVARGAEAVGFDERAPGAAIRRSMF